MESLEGLALPKLRYRRFFGGYRREEVDGALLHLRVVVRSLELERDVIHTRTEGLETDLRSARSDLDLLRAREAEVVRTLTRAQEEAAELERAARERAREIVAESEEDAARLRQEAAILVETAQSLIQEAVRARDSAVIALRQAAVELEAMPSKEAAGVVLEVGDGDDVARASSDIQEQPPGEVGSEPGTGAAPPPEAIEQTREAGHAPAPSAEASAAPVVPAPTRRDSLYAGAVEIDAGPFRDFASLSAFERALARLPHVDDVYIRTLSEDRALIDLTVSQPLALLDVMRDSLPYKLVAHGAGDNAVVVDVYAESRTGAR